MDLKVVWNKEEYQKLIVYLKSIGEEDYRNFNRRIISTQYEMLGIRLPALRKIASEIFKGDYPSFLKIHFHDYYELIFLRGLVLAQIKNLEELMTYFYPYLEFIDNWAITDSFCGSLKIVPENKDYFLTVIDQLIGTKEEYKVRVALILLLNYYVSAEYLTLIYHYLDSTISDYYYINMARAWLLCEVFIKYQKETLVYLEKNKLDKFTLNKAISKIRDSYRVSKEMKDYLLKYKK